jgi:hypothetical protein
MKNGETEFFLKGNNPVYGFMRGAFFRRLSFVPEHRKDSRPPMKIFLNL